MSASASRKLTIADALTEMRADNRIFPRKKDTPLITDSTYTALAHQPYDEMEVPTTAMQKREAHTRGFDNIHSLATLGAKQLDDEIDALNVLHTDLHTAVGTAFHPDTAAIFEDLGLRMAKTASTSTYRTSKVSPYESASGTAIEATGYDEFAQTSITASRSGGRAQALHQLDGHIHPGIHKRLNTIHELMSITTSYVRGDTAGIASEHDDDPAQTRAQHPTSKDLRVTGGGANSTYIHRMRTGVMQQAEAEFVGAHTSLGASPPLMADRQRVRLDAATLVTTHMFNAPPTPSTLSSMSAENRDKMMHISGTREVAKALRGTFGVNNPPPSPWRNRD